jgi:hypothetical protein
MIIKVTTTLHIKEIKDFEPDQLRQMIRRWFAGKCAEVACYVDKFTIEVEDVD